MFESTNAAANYLIKHKFSGIYRNDALIYVMTDCRELSRVMCGECLTQTEMIKSKWRLMRTPIGCYQLLKQFKHLLQEGEQEIVYQIMCEDPSTVYNYYLNFKSDIPLLERRRLLDIILISQFHARYLLIMKEALNEDMNYILTICRDKSSILYDFLSKTYAKDMDQNLQIYRNKALGYIIHDSRKCYELVEDKKVSLSEKFIIHEANWKTYFEWNRKSFKRMYEYAKMFNGDLNLEEERHMIFKVLKPDKEDFLSSLRTLKLSNDALALIDSYYMAKKMAMSQKIL